MSEDCGKTIIYCCHYSTIFTGSIEKKYHVPISGCNIELFICAHCFEKLAEWVKMILQNY